MGNGRFSTTRLGLVSASKQQFTDFADLEQKNLCNLRNLLIKSFDTFFHSLKWQSVCKYLGLVQEEAHVFIGMDSK